MKPIEAWVCEMTVGDTVNFSCILYFTEDGVERNKRRDACVEDEQVTKRYFKVWIVPQGAAA